ncbi:EamA family transporter [Qaidamihabitans albus]|uniref:EamA family transporter n=1 Tax=Qaidamihabitans albus TaxID=2795733 RepID=UPI0018F1C425|nr:EamA family transporter [Qaidamihabitans albus]
MTVTECTGPTTATGRSDTWRLTSLTALAPVAWGTTFLITAEWLPPDRPLLSGVIRALPAGLIALAITRTLPRGAWWWRAAVLGALNIGVFFPLLFIAAYRLPGGVAATLNAVQPLVVAGFAVALLRERPTPWRLGWGVAGVAGVATMMLRGNAAFDPVGVLAGITAVVAMAAGLVLAKRWERPVGALTFAGWQLTAGGVLLAPLALALEGPPPALDAPALAGYAWLSIAGALLAYTLWFRGLSRLPVAALSFLPLLSPAVATALGWLVLGESLTFVQGLGFALALASVAAAQLDPRRHPAGLEPRS